MKREEIQNGETIYDRYKNERQPTRDLPIYEYRQQILSEIQKNVIVVLEGATGCGKTTQVPQYILDDHAERNLYCNIIVAQPRRIAAASNARRVCRERNWRLGSIVGYQVSPSWLNNVETIFYIFF